MCSGGPWNVDAQPFNTTLACKSGACMCSNSPWNVDTQPFNTTLACKSMDFMCSGSLPNEHALMSPLESCRVHCERNVAHEIQNTAFPPAMAMRSSCNTTGQPTIRVRCAGCPSPATGSTDVEPRPVPRPRCREWSTLLTLLTVPQRPTRRRRREAKDTRVRETTDNRLDTATIPLHNSCTAVKESVATATPRRRPGASRPTERTAWR